MQSIAIGLFLLLARRLAAPAALLGAAFFAVHPALFTTLYWISARSDLLAAGFALLATALALRDDRARWLAVPAFALALLSKESVLLAPAALWLMRARCRPPSGRRWTPDRLDGALFAVSAAYGVFLANGGMGSIGPGGGATSAYALDFGRALLMNLTTYAGWTVDVTMRPSPLRFVDVRNPGLYWPGLVALVIWAALCAVPSLRRRGWHVAGVTFLLLLAPVLPLRNHTYHYFLYAPLLAGGWCVAAGADALFARLAAGHAIGTERTPRGLLQRHAWWLAGPAALLLVWNGAALVRRMESRPMRVYPALRGDPIVDRSRIARRVIDGLQAASLPPGADLVFLFRERLALLARIARGSGEAPPPDEPIYPEQNVATALFDGAGVRAFFPEVRSVSFPRDSFLVTDATRAVVYAATGEVEVFTAAELDSVVRSAWVLRW